MDGWACFDLQAFWTRVGDIQKQQQEMTVPCRMSCLYVTYYPLM